jgi:hypothetical protein
MQKGGIYMKNTSLFVATLLTVMLISGCRVGEDDPWLTFRSRDKRLLGSWEFTYKYTDSISNDFKLDIRSTGEVYSHNYKDSLVYFGRWRWVSENEELKRKESFIIEYYDFRTFHFFVTSLRYNKIEAFYFPFTTEPEKTFTTTFRRMK